MSTTGLEPQLCLEYVLSPNQILYFNTGSILMLLTQICYISVLLDFPYHWNCSKCKPQSFLKLINKITRKQQCKRSIKEKEKRRMHREVRLEGILALSEHLILTAPKHCPDYCLICFKNQWAHGPIVCPSCPINKIHLC